MIGLLRVLEVMIVFFIIYSVVPNIFTRMFHVFVLYRLREASNFALTFDDGPDTKYTPRLLDTLREESIQATFFVVAEKALKYPDIVRRMMDEGHQVEVHGFTHSFVPLLFPRRAIYQLRGSSAALEHTFSLRTRFYRPTWGMLNFASLLYALFTKTHRMVTWSIMVGDWRSVPEEELLRRIGSKLHPGAIAVLHDSDESFGAEAGSPENVVALIPKLAELVRGRGYEFTTLEGRQ